MKEVRVSTIIRNEIDFRELNKNDHAGASVYQKIIDAKPTAKGKFVKVLLDDAEFKELLQEADYWNGAFDEFMMPRGEWLSWKALFRQMKAMA
jgi:hypothetical protein